MGVGGGSGPTGLWEGGGEGAPQAPVEGPPQVGKRRSTVHWQAAGKPRSGRPEREKQTTHTHQCARCTRCTEIGTLANRYLNPLLSVLVAYSLKNIKAVVPQIAKL